MVNGCKVEWSSLPQVGLTIGKDYIYVPLIILIWNRVVLTRIYLTLFYILGFINIVSGGATVTL